MAISLNLVKISSRLLPCPALYFFLPSFPSFSLGGQSVTTCLATNYSSHLVGVINCSNTDGLVTLAAHRILLQLNITSRLEMFSFPPVSSLSMVHVQTSQLGTSQLPPSFSRFQVKKRLTPSSEFRIRPKPSLRTLTNLPTLLTQYCGHIDNFYHK